VRHDFGDAVGALKNVGIREDEKDALGRTLDEAAGCFEDGGAGAFGADEGAGDVETVFGEKVVEVVSGDAAGDVGKFLADEIVVVSGDLLEGIVDLTSTVRFAAARYFRAAGRTRASVPT
jgi:hypothetical protein